MLLTHYFAVWVVTAMAIYAIVRFDGLRRRRAVGAIACAVIVFALAWGPSMLGQFRSTAAEANYFRDNESGFVWRWLDRLALVPYRLLNEPLPNSDRFAYFFVPIMVIPILLLRRRPELLLWTLLALMAIVPIALLDAMRHTWLLALIRYALVAGPAVYG